MEKLIIITSPHGNEYGDYWGISGKNNPIVKNGNDEFGDAQYQMVFEGDINYEAWTRLEELVVDNGYLVMIHYYQEKRFEKRSFNKGERKIEYHVYYYSTQDASLNGDLWNIDNNYCYSGDDSNPKYPFDKLRSGILRNEPILNSIEEIVKWVENKIQTTDLLEEKLKLLHFCLTPEGAAQAIENKLPNKFGELTTVSELANKSDPLSKEYIKKLSDMRDRILII